MKHSFKTVAFALGLGLLLASCGGGGGNPGTSVFGGGGGGGTGTGGTTAAALTLQLSSSNIQNGGAATVTATATATTATGQALADIPVTFAVDNGATFTQTSATTDANGLAVATVSIGADPSNRIINVTATSNGLTASAPFAVTGAKLTGTPNPLIVAPGSSGNKVDFTLVNANASPMANQAITVTAGSLSTVTSTTDTNGKYSYVYTAPATTGALDITATAGGVSNTQTILVQSGTTTVPPATDASGNPGVVASASVSANPSVVATNTSTTSNQTEIRALFVGPSNSPLKNVRVAFDLAGDLNSIGGTFSTGSNVVYTDANGVATTSYIPGTRASPTNGVTIRACYNTVDFTAGTCPSATSTTITVASDPLAVSIGSNGVIVIPTANLTYIRQFVVLVVDASGRAKANVDIVPSLDLPVFLKGQYVHGATWVQGTIVGSTLTLRNPVACINEDTNRNGILESVEDLNHSGSLEPRKSDATITILGTGKTDANGSATVQVEYPQNVGSWLQIKILVSATGVSGTEGRATWTEILPVPATAISAATTPPFVVSPYGVVIDPANVAIFPDGTGPATAVAPCNNPY